MIKPNWTLWFTGLHGSGKSTIARKLIEIFRKDKVEATLLDGDELRKTISSDLGYSLEERNEHMKRVANLCKENSQKGILTIASVASPTEQSRDYARKILNKMILIYVKCPLEIWERRDVKGHYKKVKRLEKGFENFVGKSVEFEEPKNPDIILETDKETVDESINKLLDKLEEKRVS